MKIHFIAIVGGTGAGKTWLAERLIEEFGGLATRLSLDDFYCDLSHLPMSEREATNFDHPDAIDWELFQRCLGAIAAGESVRLPIYDFNTHTRRPVTAEWSPRPLVILDGLWLLRPAALRGWYSASIFIDCSEEIRLERRIERDQRERGRCVDAVRAQFWEQAAPMHHQFVSEQAQLADLRVESPTSPARIAELAALIRKLMSHKSLP